MVTTSPSARAVADQLIVPVASCVGTDLLTVAVASSSDDENRANCAANAGVPNLFL
jgi:hypothetical protein